MNMNDNTRGYSVREKRPTHITSLTGQLYREDCGKSLSGIYVQTFRRMFFGGIRSALELYNLVMKLTLLNLFYGW